MKVLIIDQCSGSKSYPSGSRVLSKDEVDSTTLEELVEEDGVAAKEARNLYTGRQQKFIDEATNLLRQADADVDRYFISAGFGLVDESTVLPAYEVTFGDMNNEEIRQRSSRLRIQEDLITILENSAYDVVFLPLGKNYYTALDLPEVYTAAERTPVVVFNREDDEGTFENVLSIAARTDQAKKFRVITVELKGKLLKNFASHIADGQSVTGLEDIREYCLTETSPEKGLDRF